MVVSEEAPGTPHHMMSLPKLLMGGLPGNVGTRERSNFHLAALHHGACFLDSRSRSAVSSPGMIGGRSGFRGRSLRLLARPPLLPSTTGDTRGFSMLGEGAAGVDIRSGLCHALHKFPGERQYLHTLLLWWIPLGCSFTTLHWADFENIGRVVCRRFLLTCSVRWWAAGHAGPGGPQLV